MDLLGVKWSAEGTLAKVYDPMICVCKGAMPAPFRHRQAAFAATPLNRAVFHCVLIACLTAFLSSIRLGHAAPAHNDPPSSTTEFDSTETVIEPRLVHLRDKEPREWTEFPETAAGKRLEVKFEAAKNEREVTCSWRQQDVKQLWSIYINDSRIGELARDENDMTVYAAISPGTLANGENLLRIEPTAGNQPSDDIRVGQIRIIHQPRQAVLGESHLEIQVTDADSTEPIPCRLTIVDAQGTLQTTGAESNEQLAVRPGVIYSASGSAQFSVPAGRYTIFAGRGFEYSLARAEITVEAGQTVRPQMAIRRVVPTDGYVACDTHVHTLTHSGHGDATINERLITLAGEGIELLIATDHNIHVDYAPLTEQLKLRRVFTPVIGNEVTTTVGHFNIFSIEPNARVADYKRTDWAGIFGEIYATPGVRVAVLNHARDLHSGTRPFGPKRHNAAVGENLDGWPFRFNAMEVVNSSATQSDPWQLFHDWMTLLNRGYEITPVGSSDSHDVARHFVGQGRTYIRCDDRDPGQINVAEAVDHFLKGQVLVSYGLIAELTVNGSYHSGDVAFSAGDTVRVDLRVLGPHWVHATEVRLYSNGTIIRQQRIGDGRDPNLPDGVQWQGRWEVPMPKHDVHLVAIAMGDGIREPYWRTAKPYQPTSPVSDPHTFGCSGAVWLDADSDGRRTAARTYAEQLCAGGGDSVAVITKLNAYDAAVAIQAAHLLKSAGKSINSDPVRAALENAPEPVKQGFRTYTEACRASERARLGDD